jgi:phosphate starvation-inducible PhoH-like protein
MSKKKTSISNVKVSRNFENKIHSNGSSSKLVIAVSHKNEGQKNALKTISQNKVTFISGVSGSGKSHMAVGWGLQEMMMHDRFEKIILTRPVVEAGESLGYLPGDATAKIAPYMLPVMDILEHYLGYDLIEDMVEERKILIMPLAYMRGTTFKNSYVVADEMQNSSIKQMHLLLTRIGENSKIVITGDTEQSDLYKSSEDNGLQDAISRLTGIENIGMVELGYESCVRDPIVSEIDKRYRPKKIALPSWHTSKKSKTEYDMEVTDSEDPRIFDYDQNEKIKRK